MSEIYLYEPKNNKNADYNVFMAFPECESFSLSSLGYMWLSKILEEDEEFNAERISTDTNKTRINPKEIDDKNVGCKFCKYKDICYMTTEDIVKLKKIENVFSEVNDNAKMD